MREIGKRVENSPTKIISIMIEATTNVEQRV